MKTSFTTRHHCPRTFGLGGMGALCLELVWNGSESGLGRDFDAEMGGCEYLALLTHSGSRGAGAQVCQHYSRLALERHAYLPRS